MLANFRNKTYLDEDVYEIKEVNILKIVYSEEYVKRFQIV